ncbi:Alpha-protein kinase 3 [Merluccius polli]|uniref:non-specific serine/threonine protein kinase n=1 Tax=Merluccius polli TaxID=89951 RepID=A0AA47MJW8_MERPO|nr:Alpha-protein kinase 3 [Merluccius polli]
MSSRRVMQRSYSGDGRTGLNNGDDVSGSSGSSRPASRSYLSDVRPESRSTLCSVMAQLTEETQPTIDVTLKSKAVSEKSKVTFTCEVRGHPIPDVIWYKDDVQLDRYCGLPKYEIFRNGPNHSLHIYNCTMEDAAIYQASASNTKGIVSCSGVLEVGLMNEYLIHQRYFSKLKQKAETRRRELGVQENQGVAEQENQGVAEQENQGVAEQENQGVAEQEPLRNLSPDRSQRKRRSPMAPHFSAPSSMEEVSATTGEHHALPGPGAQAAVEARLRDPTSAETVEKPAPVANGTSAAPTVNGHAGVTENGGKGITYVYDSVQKVFAAHQPKTPFAKKKIKISNSAEGVKADAQGERVSEERSSNVRACETQAPTELVNTQGPLEEVMEVERSIPSTPLDLAPPANTEAGQKRATETVLNVDKTPSKEDKICLDTAVGRLQRAEVPTQKKKPVPNTRPVNVSPAVSLRNRHGAHGTESKQDKLVHQEKVGDRDTKKNYLDSRSQKSSPKVSPAQRQPAQRQPAQVVTPQQPLSSNKKQTDIKRSGVTAGDIAVRPTAAEHQTPSTVAPQSRTAASVATSLPAVGPLKHSDSSCPTRQETTLQRCLSPGDAENAFPQSPGEPGGKKETSSRLENVSVSEPQQLAEVCDPVLHELMNCFAFPTQARSVPQASIL